MADTKISALPASTTPLVGAEVLPLVQSGATKQVSVSNLTAGRAVSMSSLGVNVASIIGTAAIGVPVTTTVGKLSDSGLNFIGAGSLGNYSQYTAGAYSASAINYAPVAFGYVATSTSGSNTGDFFVATRSATTDTAPTINFKVTSAGNASVLNGNLVIGTSGKGIDFSATSQAGGMTSELLSDYEEGTWTPTDQSGVGLSITVDHAYYTKVGRLVTVNAYITYPVTADASSAKISLPFTAAKFDIGTASATSGNVYSTITAGSSAACTFRSLTIGTLLNANLSGAQILFSISYTV